ncbi:MAG: hypothetical protein FWG09_06140, partial [Synergistaceae bacterium]|nr:hypothetical protein [Synergistaceae bacterium]
KFGEFLFLGELEYSWDRMWDEKKFRPDISLRYERPYWFAQLRWRSNQYMEIQKNADYQYRGQLDTAPEFLIGTPWFKGGEAWYRVSALWGTYRASTILNSGVEETEPWKSRLKLTAEGYFESEWGSATPFMSLNASMMFYDKESMRQDVLNSIVGLKYGFGGMKLGTAYARSWVSGETPMNWDKEFENEKIYQMMEVPIGRYFYFCFLGGYDLNASFLEEMNYTLRYLNDCMIWELTYRNDRNWGGENKLFFRVGFTGTSLEFKNEEKFDPFVAPVPQN